MTTTNPEKVARAIGKLTGRIPASRNLDYLTARLARLQARVARGDDVRVHVSRRSIPMSISLPSDAHDAVQDMAKKEKVSNSVLVRRALAAYAATLHPDFVDEFEDAGP